MIVISVVCTGVGFASISIALIMYSGEQVVAIYATWIAVVLLSALIMTFLFPTNVHLHHWF